MRSLARYWKWGPVALGLGIGVPLMFADCPLWGGAFVAGGIVVSLGLVGVPVALDSTATRLTRRAYRRQGLEWPPVAQGELVGERREAAEHIAVELENNAGLIGTHLVENRYWNTSAHPLVATAFHHYSRVLARDPAFSKLLRRVGSLHNEMNLLNPRIKRAWERQRPRPAEKRSISADDRRRFRDLRKKLNDVRIEVLVYADNL